MTSLRITGFQGIAPRVSPRRLNDTNAQVAANCTLTSGELKPMSRPRTVSEPTKGVQLKTIYLADTVWFTWPIDVDVARSPLPGEQKFIYSGDGEPRITTVALAAQSGNNDYPSAARALGVPPPQSPPSVTASGGTSQVVSRFYVYTFFDDFNQESAPSPTSSLVEGEVDGTWEITGMDESPSNGDTGTVSVEGPPGEEITTFSNDGAALHWLRPGDQVYLEVSGEQELATVFETPTPDTFTVQGDYTGAAEWSRVAPWGASTKRLYRTTGLLGQFQLVADEITGTTFTDTLDDGDILGDDLVSGDWELPPTDLKGVVTLPSGALAGFSDNEVCFSEPFQPHAWPRKFRLRSEFKIVSVNYYSSGLVAGTTGNPLQVLGIDPGEMVAQPVNGAYPCLSKRSTISLVDSVGYASEQGFVTIGDSGVNILTSDWFTRDEWVKRNPKTMFASALQGRVFIHTQAKREELLMFDFLDGTGLTVYFCSVTAMYADPISGKLYQSCRNDKDVREVNPVGGAFLQQDWWSKEFVLPKPINLGAVKVNFFARFTQEQVDELIEQFEKAVAFNEGLITSGRINGELNSQALNAGFFGASDLAPAVSPATEAPGVDFTLYTRSADDPQFAPVYSRFLNQTSKTFRLPAGYKSDRFSVRVQGQVLVKSIELAETASELAQA